MFNQSSKNICLSLYVNVNQSVFTGARRTQRQMTLPTKQMFPQSNGITSFSGAFSTLLLQREADNFAGKNVTAHIRRKCVLLFNIAWFSCILCTNEQKICEWND